MKKCWCGNKALEDYSKTYYKCTKCKTLITKHDLQENLYDVENEENDLYGKNYWEVSMTQAAGKSTLSEVVDMYLSERVIYWLKGILKYVKLGADVAEVGCGLGQLQYLLRRVGYEQKAFELSQGVCDFMETQLGVVTHCGPFEPTEKAYDGILAFDLFEHLIEPKQFLEYCVKSLRENGVLCFQTPQYDSAKNYEEMQREKPRFEEQLKAEQHIFLYSKEAITEILRQYGFTNIFFEPAFFGDDYDMFLFASQVPIKINTEKEIDDYLNSVPNGRLVKALITLFDNNRVMQGEYQKADEDRKERLAQIVALEGTLKESEADRALRQEQIERLTGMLKESEADRALRQEQIERLTGMLKESEADRALRQEQIEQLTGMLKESEADREARFEQICELTRIVQEFQKEEQMIQEVNTGEDCS